MYAELREHAFLGAPQFWNRAQERVPIKYNPTLPPNGMPIGPHGELVPANSPGTLNCQAG
jgi:hypothetical protein